MRWSVLVPVGAALLAVWTALGRLGDLRNGGIPPTEVLQFAAALLFLVALVVVRRAEGPPSDRVLLGILLVGLLGRLALLGAEPSLSTDYYRYVWEGRAQWAGANPYLTPPADPSLAALRDGVFLRVNHAEIPAVYGPLLELLFAATAGWTWALKGVFLLADGAVALLLLRLLRRRGLSPAWVLAWWWHPLVVLEVAGQGHLEVLPVALLVLAVDLEESGRSRWGALALGSAIAAKYLPLLIVPAWIMRGARGRDRLGRLLGVALPGLLAGLPYLAAARPAGLLAYGESWRFNAGGFELLDWLLRACGLAQAFCRHLLPHWVQVPEGFDPAEHQNWIQLPAKLLVAGLLLAWIGWTLLRQRRGRPLAPAALAFQAGALFLVLSPVVHPWYALWMLPFLALGPGRAAWLYLSLVLPLAYWVLLGYDGTPESWREPGWVRWVEFGPAALLLLGFQAARWRSGDAEPGRSALPGPPPADKTGPAHEEH